MTLLSTVNHHQCPDTNIKVSPSPYFAGMLIYGVQEDASLDKADFLSLNLVDAYLQYRFDLGSGMADIVSPNKITLNVWHKVEISRRDKQGMMVIDDDIPVTGSAQVRVITLVTLVCYNVTLQCLGGSFKILSLIYSCLFH